MTTDKHCLSTVVMVLQHIVAPLDIQRQRSDATSSNRKDTTGTDLHKQSELPPPHSPRDTVKVFL